METFEALFYHWMASFKEEKKCSTKSLGAFILGINISACWKKNPTN